MKHSMCSVSVAALWVVQAVRGLLNQRMVARVVSEATKEKIRKRQRDANGAFLPTGHAPMKVHGLGRGQNPTNNLSPMAEVIRNSGRLLIPVSVEVMSKLDTIIENGLQAVDLEVDRLRIRAEEGPLESRDRTALANYMDMLGKFKRTELAAMQIERKVEESMSPEDVEHAIKVMSGRLKKAGMLGSGKEETDGSTEDDDDGSLHDPSDD